MSALAVSILIGCMTAGVSNPGLNLQAVPLLADYPILFVVRKQYKPDHHNTETMFQKGEINEASFEGGSALKTLDASSGRVQTLLECPEGVIRDPEVYFDGSKILFSMRRNAQDAYHIYEIGAQGGEPKQLTRAEGITDIDPLYLPDDSIVFSSTREPKYCMCNRHIMANLFRMDPDGANIHQIGKSTLFEGHPSLLPDGRILYDRWEYVDRNFGDAQGLWTVYPDGTNHALYWGNNTNSPGAVLEARSIPGAQQIICTFSSCHDRPWGAIAIVDRRLGLDGRPPVLRTWPAAAIDLIGKGDFDTYKQVQPKYEDPYPLDETHFLCARMTGSDEEMGIYLLDDSGNDTLIHSEAPGCYDPMPLAPRHRPPMLPARRAFDQPEGTMYVADVYQGTHMNGVARGSVKFLRVVEAPEKRFWTHPSWNGQGQEAPAMNWHDFNNKRILGTVPVEADGSVCFTLPAEKFVYFQLLDADGMMVQSMRSGTIIQPGERAGCTGCHENRRAAPPLPAAEFPMALRRAPSVLNGWHGPARTFNYLEEVQPVFDAHCVRCHDYGKHAGKKLNLARDRTLTFNTSYTELWRKGFIKAIGAGPADTQHAYAWGSHASKVVSTLRAGHKKVNLSPEEFSRIVTWIDINAPYYPEYASAYPGNLAGRSPLTPEQVKRLSELTRIPFAELADCAKNQGPLVVFDRPERSPCLASLRKKRPGEYQEALGILRAGKETLEKQPDAGHPGFSLCGADLAREKRYQTRQSEEARNRGAIRSNTKAYDP